ncbi:Oxidation resistance protein 1 [Seminavis robusta]|uniref:Oxidation resistance protein 1 n=1 Tax=Seminavis robusta TaxID=568900 RepID=A0A9N8ED33_9STRA|nr:Oxidation resistance protein 1 [Seminavis robusta]|eukprot:Sro999_g229690.1 Oxidation resistance protein 1 (668) ;mRNA; r:30408-32411
MMIASTFPRRPHRRLHSDQSLLQWHLSSATDENLSFPVSHPTAIPKHHRRGISFDSRSQRHSVVASSSAGRVSGYSGLEFACSQFPAANTHNNNASTLFPSPTPMATGSLTDTTSNINMSNTHEAINSNAMSNSHIHGVTRIESCMLRNPALLPNLAYADDTIAKWKSPTKSQMTCSDDRAATVKSRPLNLENSSRRSSAAFAEPAQRHNMKNDIGGSGNIGGNNDDTTMLAGTTSTTVQHHCWQAPVSVAMSMATVATQPQPSCKDTHNATLGTTNPMQSLLETVVHAVENVQEQRRRASSRKRISQTLLTLRAAAEVHYQQQQQSLDEDEETREDFKCGSFDDEQDQEHQPDHDDLASLGSALFCPLDPGLLKHHHHRHLHRQEELLTTNSSSSDSNDVVVQEPQPQILTRLSSSPLPIIDTMPMDVEEEEKKQDEVVPVQILPELGCLATNPRLLSYAMFQQLVTDGVPECLHMNAWERVYSIGRDGDSFRTLLDKCAPYRQSILVVQTTSGYLLGGFVSDAWQEQDGYHQRHSYYGNGVSFLFASHPATTGGVTSNNNNHDDNEDKPLTIYPWTGSNDFCQICDREKSVIAMGGAGAFGFILEDDFFRGSTDTCGTFGNPPLTLDKDGIFTVAAMEIYGLVPLFANPYNHSSPRSTILSGMTM